MFSGKQLFRNPCPFVKETFNLFLRKTTFGNDRSMFWLDDDQGYAFLIENILFPSCYFVTNLLTGKHPGKGAK